MKQLTPTAIPDDLAGSYGQEWTTGVLVDHEHYFTGYPDHNANGERVLPGIHGSVPVLCGEIVRIYTEDGPIDGRCGTPVKGDDFSCPTHQRRRDEWRNQSETELMEWEMRLEEDR